MSSESRLGREGRDEVEGVEDEERSNEKNLELRGRVACPASSRDESDEFGPEREIRRSRRRVVLVV